MNLMQVISALGNEIMLLALMLLIIVHEVFGDKSGAGFFKWQNIAATMGMLLITVIAFLPKGEVVLFGGMFRGDALTGFMKAILNLGTLVVFLQSRDWLEKPENRLRSAEYYSLIISTLIGMNFLISSGDFIMLFIGLELATLPLAALASFEVTKSRSAEAGIKMILSAAFASGISLLGISFIYALGGSIYFEQIAIVQLDSPLYIMAFVFFFSGLAFKISIVPYHLWTADVYEGAPVNITSFLSVMSKGSALFILMILFFKFFRTSEEIWSPLVYVTAILTMTLGNFFALRQKNIKRFLAFSSIAQAGFLFLGIYSGSTMGMNATIYFILVYLFSNLGAFGVVAVISNATDKENIEDYNGLYKTNPKLSLLMLLSLFSLAGIPPVAGFFGKFFLFMAAAGKGSYILVLIATLNATLSLYYYLLVIKAMFINKNDNPIPAIHSSLSSRLAMSICLAGILLIGFFGSIHHYIQGIAEKFLS